MEQHQILHTVLLQAFKNQDELNKRLTPDWAVKGFPYYRAVWTELAEAIQHANWLWWKTEQYDKPLSTEQLSDIHIEMCDILHFGMSMDIIDAQAGKSPESSIDYQASTYRQWFDFKHTGEVEFYASIEQVVVTAITKRVFDAEFFARACYSIGLSLSKLLVLYFGKATLNRFRWDHGYSLPKGHPDKYIKMWPALTGGPGAVEDNVHMHQLVDGLMQRTLEEDLVRAIMDGSFMTQLYDRLASRYPGKALPF